MKSEYVDAGAAQTLHVERQQRNDHQQSDHVDERRDHQGEEFRGNLFDFAVEDVDQRDRNDAQQHAHEWRLERMREIRLNEEHWGKLNPQITQITQIEENRKALPSGAPAIVSCLAEW